MSLVTPFLMIENKYFSGVYQCPQWQLWKFWKKSVDPSFCYKFLKFWQKTSHFAKSARKSAKNGWTKKKIYFHILNPWVLRNTRQGGDHQICEEKAKSLHPTLHPQFISLDTTFNTWSLIVSKLCAVWRKQKKHRSLGPLCQNIFTGKVELLLPAAR